MHIYSCVLCFRASICEAYSFTTYEYSQETFEKVDKATLSNGGNSRMEKKHDGTAVVLTMLADAQLVHDLILGSVHCPPVEGADQGA